MHLEAIISSAPFFVAAFLLGLLGTFLARLLALRFRVVDDPGTAARKRQVAPVPLLGGLGVVVAVVGATAAELSASGGLLSGALTAHHFLILLLASLVLVAGGVLDDMVRLSPWQQIVFPVGAAAVVILGGIGIHEVNNPFGGTISVGSWQIVTFFWLLGMTYTTKLLDGVDGLATGITAIGALMIALLAWSVPYFQPDIARFAIIFFGALLGFLAWNFHPAKIYLGEAGSTFLGFFLGILAIISGSKIATALLVMGIPALDVVQVMVRRALEGRSVFSGDRAHLHYRLLQAGFSTRQAVFLLYSLAAAFGLLTLFLQSRAKLIALVLLGIVMVSLLLWLRKRAAERSAAP